MLKDNSYLLELSEGRTLIRLCNQVINGMYLETPPEDPEVKRIRRSIGRLVDCIDRTNAMVESGKFENDGALELRVKIQTLKRQMAEQKNVDKMSIMTQIMVCHTTIMGLGF